MLCVVFPLRLARTGTDARHRSSAHRASAGGPESWRQGRARFRAEGVGLQGSAPQLDGGRGLGRAHPGKAKVWYRVPGRPSGGSFRGGPYAVCPSVAGSGMGEYLGPPASHLFEARCVATAVLGTPPTDRRDPTTAACTGGPSRAARSFCGRTFRDIVAVPSGRSL